MQLTRYSDYSLRVLIYLALKGEQTSTIQEIADSYHISKNHLMKIVHQLSQEGYIRSLRGRSGGLLLEKSPEKIVLGEVIRRTEENFKIVECFDPQNNLCQISRDCKLKHVLNEALFAFLNVLDKYTLKDLIAPQSMLKESLNITDS